MAHRLSVLVSYAHLLNKTRLIEILKSDMVAREWDVYLDSGAFTNFTKGRDVVTLDDYIGFVQREAQTFKWVFNLDKIGDPVASAANMEIMREHGINPVPVFQRGANADELREMLADSPDLVCIGGISQNLNAHAERSYLHSVMQIVAEQKGNVHASLPGQEHQIPQEGFPIRPVGVCAPFSRAKNQGASQPRSQVGRSARK